MRRSLFQLSLLFLGACSGSGTTTTGTPTTHVVASVQLSDASLALLTGQTAQLSATAREANGAAVSGKTPSWISDNAAIASISTGGLVTANAPGSTNVTATVDGRSASALVTVTAPVVPVATVTLSQPSANLAVDATLQLTATPRDAHGNALTGRNISWSTTAGAVATVSGLGLVTAVGMGSAVISATSEGRLGTTTITVVLGTPAPFLQKPFAAEWITINVMDHDTPREFIDFNGRTITSWGEDVATYDSHAGYDFLMPVGTPILAAASGTVLTAESANFFCPILNTNVNQLGIQIRHTLPGGNIYQTYYAHLSTLGVTVGQVVAAGQQIGLSGNTGCTTVPHLHFQLDRTTGTNNGQLAHVDPFGWTGAGTDPWSVNAVGAVSFSLWKAGQAPQLTVGLDLSTNPLNDVRATPVPRAVGITRLSFMGDRDDLNPNNEWVEIRIDPAVYTLPTYDLTGSYLRNNANDRFNFPGGFTIAQGQTVRIYVGNGTNTATTLYWGRPSGVIRNLGDCMELWLPGSQYYLFGYAVTCN